MSTYPALNDRPIDQWTVTELKDELERRYLPVSGLKDDLLKRLFDAMQDEILDGDGKATGVISPPEEPTGGEILGSIDASVNRASIEQHVDKGASEVAKQGTDLVVSVTEAYDESAFATSEVTQEAVVGTAEPSQKSLDAVAEVESCLVDTAATDETNGNALDSASSDNIIVKEANPHSEGHGDTIEKIPEDDTNKKMAVDCEPSDLTGSDIKLGLDVSNKILKLEDEPAPPDMKLHSDHEDSDAVAVGEPEDDTSKKMIIDDVPYGLTHMNVELGAKVDCKIEHEEVSTLFDATALHAYPKERIVAAAKGLVVGTAEASQRSLDVVAEVESSLVDTAATNETNGNGQDSTSSGNTIAKEANPHSEGHDDTIEKTLEDDTNKKMAIDDEPSDLTGGDIKLGFDVHSKILKLEDESAPPDDMLHSDYEDSDFVAVAEPEDNTSKKMIIDDVLSGPTHTNVELDAKVDCKIEQEEVSILSDATALHAYPKEHIVAVAKGLVVGTAEASQRSLDVVAEVESSLADIAATDETNGNGLDSTSSGNAIAKEVNPHCEGHGDTIEKTPEDDTNKKMVVNDEPFDLTGGDIKLGLNVHSKILKLENEPALQDSDAVAVAEPEDDTSKKMIIDDVPSGPTDTNVELGAKVDCKIEQEEVSTLSDATAVHAYHKERIVDVAKGLVVGTAEASPRSLDVVAEVESSLADKAATDETNGNGLDSTSSGNTIVKEANPYSEGHGDTIEKTTEDDTNKKMAVGDGPFDLTGGDIKLGLSVHSKILKLEDEPALPDDMLHRHHEDSDTVAVAEPEDDTSKKMIIDDVPSGATTNVELGAKVDCKIKQEEVSTLSDATAVHAYPKEHIVDATKGLVVGTAEASPRSLDVVAEVESSLVNKVAADETTGNGLDSTSSCNTIVKEANPKFEGHGDTIEKTTEDDTNKKMAVDDGPFDLTGGDIKLGLNGHSRILKLEDEPALPDDMLHSDHEDSDTLAVAEPEDDTSKKMIMDVPSGPTLINVELGAKVDCKIEQEEVAILSDATALHAYPKEHIMAQAKGLALPRTLTSGYTSNIDFDRKEESPDRNSREKLNLDRSSGDESMDEDVMESRHADSYIKSDDLRGKTEVTSEHVFKEVSLLDTHTKGSSAHSKEVVTKEKPPTPTEKRKPEDPEVIENNEPIKRRRQWNKDAVNISDQQASKISTTGTQKEVICPAPERSFGKPNKIARRISPKERIVDEAVATRNAVYNLQWPPNNHSYLIAEFVDPEEVKLKLETPPQSQVPVSPNTVTAPQAATFQQPEANQTQAPPHAPTTSRGVLPTPAPFAKLPPTSDPGPARESLPPPPPMKVEPARTLDDLFKKTQAYPRIYYMPLSEEEVSAKCAAHGNGKRG